MPFRSEPRLAAQAHLQRQSYYGVGTRVIAAVRMPTTYHKVRDAHSCRLMLNDHACFDAMRTPMARRGVIKRDLAIKAHMPLIGIALVSFLFFSLVVADWAGVGVDSVNAKNWYPYFISMLYAAGGLFVASLGRCNVFFSIHLHKNERVNASERARWNLLMVFLGTIAYPLYWRKFLKDQ